MYRRLDPKKLTSEGLDYFIGKEGLTTSYLVEADRARDQEWTEEVMAATCGYVLTETDSGEVVAEFDTLAEAMSAKSRARITFSLELDDEDVDA
jgi:hypothetical protein